MKEQTYSREQIEEIRRKMEQRLSPQRFAHSVQVAEIAVHFARKEGYDETKAEMAGLLHDVAREFTEEQFKETAEKYAIKLNRFNRSFPPSIHGKIGAGIVERELGITDPEILMAIRNHVSGRPCMKTLEQVLYLADHIARGYTYMAKESEALLDKSTAEALYIVLGYVINYDAKNKKPVDERTLQTFDWMLDQIRDEERQGPADIGEIEWQAVYTRMDELMDLCAEKAVRGFPAENTRDLGGYQAADGRRIRKRKILRSGNLNRFTAADYEKLAAMGINTVIDLRTEKEKPHEPDLGNSGIRYMNIPFETTGESKSYIEVLLERINECEDSEESAWLAAKYFDAFDIDGMYLQLLLAPDSAEKFRKILRILQSDDCTGVLFFCHSGKDRTGITAALIMHVLGIGNDTVLKDYMVSQIPYYAITMKYLNQLWKKDYNLTVQQRVIDVLGVEADRPIQLNREILEKFGSYREFFDIGKVFGEEELERFREKYLSPEEE